MTNPMEARARAKVTPRPPGQRTDDPGYAAEHVVTYSLLRSDSETLFIPQLPIVRMMLHDDYVAIRFAGEGT
jgi:hypothetical protein